MNIVISKISSSMHLDKPGWIDRHFLCDNDKNMFYQIKSLVCVKTVAMEKSSAYDRVTHLEQWQTKQKTLLGVITSAVNN